MFAVQNADYLARHSLFLKRVGKGIYAEKVCQIGFGFAVGLGDVGAVIGGVLDESGVSE